MPEEILNNTNAVPQGTENEEHTEEKTEIKEDTGKKYTQDDLDKILKKNSARYLRKITGLEEKLSRSRTSEKIKSLIAEEMGISGDDDEAVLKAVCNFYGKDGAKILNDYKNGEVSKREADIKLQTLEFLENEDTTDEDIVLEYENIANKPKSKITRSEQIKLEMLSKRYFKVVSRNEARKSEEWYKSNVGDDFEKLVSNPDFTEFIKDLSIPLSSAVKKYCSLKGITKSAAKKAEQEESAKKDEPAKKYSMGNVKDTGTAMPEYFSREDVEKMSIDEVMKNYDAIKKSEKKWYK